MLPGVNISPAASVRRVPVRIFTARIAELLQSVVGLQSSCGPVPRGRHGAAYASSTSQSLGLCRAVGACLPRSLLSSARRRRERAGGRHYICIIYGLIYYLLLEMESGETWLSFLCALAVGGQTVCPWVAP
jgi:hypothetical protein